MLIKFDKSLPLQTSKGKKTLYHDNHLYYQKKVEGECIYWTCHHSECGTTVKTSHDEVIFVKKKKRKLGTDLENEDDDVVVHSCFPDCIVTRSAYYNQQARDQIIRYVRLGIDFGEAYNGVSASLTDPAVTDEEYVLSKGYRNLVTKESIRSAATAAKLKNLPKEPKTIYEIDSDVMNEFSMLTGVGGELKRFMMPTNQDQRIYVFATDENLITLSRSKIIHVDGTFKITPRIFHFVKGQVLVIHGYIEETSFPLVFALLPSKEYEVYECAFKIVMNFYRSTGINRAWEIAVTDLEKSLMQAVADTLQVTVRGCYFHFVQAIKRHLTGELLVFYKEGKYNFKTFFSYLKALSKLPEHEVPDCFESLWKSYKQLNGSDPESKAHFESGGVIHKVGLILNV